MTDLTYHIIPRLKQNIKERAEQIAMRDRLEDGKWSKISWGDLGEKINTLSKAFLAKGVAVQDKIAVFSQNMSRWAITDFACQQIRALAVPIYATNTAKQVAYVLNDAEVEFLFVGNVQQLESVLTVVDECPNLNSIVFMGAATELEGIEMPAQIKLYMWDEFNALADDIYDAELQLRLSQISLDDLITLIYTSGTTGVPKGVMLTHKNLAHQIKVHNQVLNANENDITLSFLPLSHVYERAWAWFALSKGGAVCFLDNPRAIKDAIQEVKPTIMCAIPRFYEKIYSAIHQQLLKKSILKKVIFTWSVNMGARLAVCKQKKNKPSWFLKRFYKIANKLVLSKIRNVVGGNIRMMPCGGATLDPTIGRFFHALGINIKLGYGMTETMATVSCWDDNFFDPDSIGRPTPGTEVKIGEENEILVRGDMVMKGYYNKPQETKEAFTEDGFLKTGDAGYIDDNGNLFITERIKDLMKTSNGKYIAPQVIEGAIGRDHLIEQIAVVADTKKFVSALIVPAFDSLEEYAKELNIIYTDRMELIRHSQIVSMFEERLNQMQKELAKFEQVKKFTLLSKAFSMDEGELTPTMKLRRKVICEKYKNKIDAMYDPTQEQAQDTQAPSEPK